MAHVETVIFIWVGICASSMLVALLLWGGLRLVNYHFGQRKTAMGILVTLLILTIIGLITYGFIRWG